MYRLYPHYKLDCLHGTVEGKNMSNKIAKQALVPISSIYSGDTFCLEFNADGYNSYIKFSDNKTHNECTITADQIVMDLKYRLAVSMRDIDMIRSHSKG